MWTSHRSFPVLAYAVAILPALVLVSGAATEATAKPKLDAYTRMCFKLDRQCTAGSAKACKKWVKRCSDGSFPRTPGKALPEE